MDVSKFCLICRRGLILCGDTENVKRGTYIYYVSNTIVFYSYVCLYTPHSGDVETEQNRQYNIYCLLYSKCWCLAIFPHGCSVSFEFAPFLFRLITKQNQQTKKKLFFCPFCLIVRIEKCRLARVCIEDVCLYISIVFSVIVDRET